MHNPHYAFNHSSKNADRVLFLRVFPCFCRLRPVFNPPFVRLSGRLNNRGAWRREAVCCSACSTSPRPAKAMRRARPRTGLVAGCAWASNAAPTWRPWMSTATQTPTLKRKDDIKAPIKCHASTLYVLVGRRVLNH